MPNKIEKISGQCGVYKKDRDGNLNPRWVETKVSILEEKIHELLDIINTMKPEKPKKSKAKAVLPGCSKMSMKNILKEG